MTLLIIALCCLSLAAFLIGEVMTLPARERSGSVRRAARYGRWRYQERGQQTSFRERALAPLATTLARTVLRLSPSATVDTIATRLLAAGLGRRIAPTGYLTLKAAGAIAGALLALLLGVAGKSLFGAIFFAIALGGLGLYLPDVIVTLKARSRKEEIRASLPDALDLLAVSVEAGLGFDGAITKLTEHMDGPLVEEFALTLGEIRIGESRHDALKKMADRVSVPEVASFTRAIVQADQLGISLGRILRVQAADSRNRRQAAAEERAMKAPIKMLFPTVLFIFPAMFLVILGPAFLNLARYF